MKKIKRYIATGLAGVLSIAAATNMTGAGMSVKASMDSSQMVMGQQMAIKLDIVDSQSKPAQLIVDKDAFPAEVEAVDWIYGDTTDLGNGLTEMKRALVIQSFDSGVYVIPPFMLVSGPDTVRSNELTLKVYPVDVSGKNDINSLAPTADFHSKWYDWLPDWLTEYWIWYLLGLIAIAAGVCAYLIATKKVAVNILPQKKRLPPDRIAVDRLNALKEEQLWERGQEKEYYTQLIDILREYLQERFGINAMEMTSSQILKALRSNEETRLPHDYMRKVVEIADYVKFAKVRPMPDDNVRSWQNAMQFVEETRPAPEPETAEDEEAGNQLSNESSKGKETK
ncbi:MAG: cell wall anchor protein [Muribaculaceae bacterium]|nr:cell wall anchor protein [Muribaculaceae bacterium]